MATLPIAEDRDPFHRAKSLAELLAWNDLDFVRCAYVTLLGRQPDPTGQTHFVALIRAGHSKLEVLWLLRQSPEAKGHDPGIAGLDRSLRRAAWERRPLLGAISRLLRADADSASRYDRALRAALNMSVVNQRHILALADRVSLLAVSAAYQSSGAEGSSPATSGAGTGQPADAIDHARDTNVLQTPDLDHLRRGAAARHFIDDIAP